MNLIIAIVCIIIAYSICKNVYYKYWAYKLGVSLKLNNYQVFEGEKLTLYEEITNKKLLPLPILQVKFKADKSFIFENEENSTVTDYYYRNDIFSILGKCKVTRKHNFTCTKRGYYTINSVDIISYDLFMQYTFANTITFDLGLYVFPKVLPIDNFVTSYKAIMTDIACKNSLITNPFLFKGIREYQSFDNMRTINWKATAKTSSLQVNTYNTTASQEIKILLNFDTNSLYKKEDKLEYIIRITATLATYFLKDNQSVGLISNGVDIVNKLPINISNSISNYHLQEINQALALLSIKDEPTDFVDILDNNVDNSLTNVYWVIISNKQSDEIYNYLQNMLNNNIAATWIIPHLADEEILYSHSNIKNWEVNIDD